MGWGRLSFFGGVMIMGPFKPSRLKKTSKVVSAEEGAAPDFQGVLSRSQSTAIDINDLN